MRANQAALTGGQKQRRALGLSRHCQCPAGTQGRQHPSLSIALPTVLQTGSCAPTHLGGAPSLAAFGVTLFGCHWSLGSDSGLLAAVPAWPVVPVMLIQVPHARPVAGRTSRLLLSEGVLLEPSLSPGLLPAPLCPPPLPLWLPPMARGLEQLSCAGRARALDA